jgi:beta-ribofuranosylaminobenzene 5'-phosphate synthase
MTDVAITTGARLHFGPLSVSAPTGGRFGGVGVMIDAPRVVLSARAAETDIVRGDLSAAGRIAEFVRRVRLAVGADRLPGCDITITEMIPSHLGFGSGTQLGLAVARATAALAGEAEPTLEALARRVGRGLRSAIGIHGFARGGFLVDGGRSDSNQLGTLVSREAFPVDWRFVIAAPRATIGLSGDAEKSAFAQQPPMPVSLTSDLCRIVLMDWLPAVIDHDFARCSESMYVFGHQVGEFFSSAQGGVFAHPRMSAWAAVVQRRGIQGVAQTSWGPTLAALCSDAAMAEQLQQDFATDANWSDCTFQVVSPLNRGATVSEL